MSELSDGLELTHVTHFTNVALKLWKCSFDKGLLCICNFAKTLDFLHTVWLQHSQVRWLIKMQQAHP